MTASSKNADIYLLLVFFIIFNDLWLNDCLGTYHYISLLSVFIFLFLTITRGWQECFFYAGIKRIKKRTIPLFLFVVSAIIVYRLSEFYFFRVGIRPGMIAVVRENGPLSVIPILEDIFFITIVFPVVRIYTYSPGRRVMKDRKSCIVYGFLVPFLICFYWFLLPHQYASNFLNPHMAFWERIRDFPVDNLFGLLCGVILFVRTRSLILVSLCHYIFNDLVWLYVYFHFSLPP